MRMFDPRGRVTLATATRAITNADGSEVQLIGNARVDRAEIERRIARFYRPYDEAIKQALAASLAAGLRPVD